VRGAFSFQSCAGKAMSTYRLLRMARFGLWGAFVLSIVLIALLNLVAFQYTDIVFAAPPLLLVLACLVGFAERSERLKNNLPVGGEPEEE
jgi:hypothetical protein